MNYKWTDLNGVETWIQTSSPIRAVLDDLASRHAKAIAEGQASAASALELLWNNQYSQWRVCSSLYYSRQRVLIGLLEKEVSQKLDWWNEWALSENRPDKPSKHQLGLIGDIPPDLTPTTWVHAAQIINLMPAYRPPLPENYPRALSAAQGALALGSKLKALAEEIMTCFGTNVPRQDQLSQYNTVASQFNEALRSIENIVDAKSKSTSKVEKHFD